MTMTDASAVPAIAIEGLHHSYGANTVLRGLDLTVRRGEIYALLGGNGAGKSTTLSALLGFVAPQAGTVRVCGIDPVADPRSARAVMAYVPENVSLYEHLTARENIGYFLSLAQTGHDIVSAVDIADRIGFLGQGRIEEERAASATGPRFDLNALHDSYAHAGAAA